MLPIALVMAVATIALTTKLEEELLILEEMVKKVEGMLRQAPNKDRRGGQRPLQSPG